MQTFNEFFIRELKHGARPISDFERDDIAVCAADCLLMAFKSVDDSKRFWIKVFCSLSAILLNQILCAILQHVSPKYSAIKVMTFISSVHVDKASFLFSLCVVIRDASFHFRVF